MYLVPAVLIVSAAALPSPGQPGSHEPYLREVKSAGVNALREALRSYDSWLSLHPRDATAAVERCKLIAGTEGEDEGPLDPQGPTSAGCVEDLGRAFPESGPVVLYQLERRWQQEAITFGESALANRRITFTRAELARVHGKLAQSHRLSGHPDLAAREARLAMSHDPSIDLTELLASVLLSEGRKAEAVAALSAHPEGNAYELQRKARQLVEAGAYFRAQWMLTRAAQKPGFEPDAELQGRIYEGTGKLREAREAYRKGRTIWNSHTTLERLFHMALSGDDAVAADQAYQELRDKGFEADPLARRRLALQWRFPRTSWRARDLAGTGALLGCALLVCLIPLLAFLPLHAFTLWRRLYRPPPQEEPGAWWFRHVYVASALVIGTQCLALYVFAYDEVEGLFSGFGNVATATPSIARFGLLYTVTQAAALLVLVLQRPQRLRLFGRGSWSFWKCAGQAWIALVLAYVTAVITGGALWKPAALGVDNLVRSLLQAYGKGVTLLLVAVLVPICEELVFRSVLLDVFSRHLRFWVANLLQATLFAAMHADPVRFVFYALMGLLSGRMRRASGGLLASILFHGANNAVAVLLIVAAGNTLRQPKAAPPPDPQLLACAKAPLAAPPRSTAQMNNLAWSVAIDRSASGACLLQAEQAIDAALRHVPDSPMYLDTKATVLFREGRVEEAIELERAAIELDPKGIYFSQLDRFLRARGTDGAPAVNAVKLAPAPDGKGLVVELNAPFDDGFVLFARQAGNATLLRLAAGPRHERSYRIPLAAPLPNGAAFEVALLDARGCDACKGGWEYRVSPHDARVDRYP